MNGPAGSIRRRRNNSTRLGRGRSLPRPRPGTFEKVHEPLSQSLAQIVTDPAAPAGITLNRLLEKTEGRGLYLVVMLLCVPFVVPVSLPGLSTVMGAIICLMALRLAFGKSPRLPKMLGERKLPASVQGKVLGGSIKFLRFLERFVRPRRTQWLKWRWARFANCCCIVLLALLLALPLPSPPFFFSNSIPSYGIILLAASMLEEDGVLIWVAYGVVVANLVFFVVIGEVIVQVILKSWHGLSHFISSV
jgi:hypothetical protein